MRAFLQTIVWNKNLITDELVKLRNDCANRPGAEEARKLFQEGQQRLTKDPNLRLKYDMRDTLPKLTIPAICIWGEDDGFAPVNLGRQLETMLPKVKFHYVAKAGHQVPEAFQGGLKDILVTLVGPAKTPEPTTLVSLEEVKSEEAMEIRAKLCNTAKVCTS